MPTSDFVFEEGEGIDVGTHGEHDFVFHEGEPVPDTGESELVFEAGTGLGPSGNHRARVYDSSGNLLAETDFVEDEEYRSGGIGWYINGADVNEARFDNYVIEDVGTVDDFSDGDLSEYSDTGGTWEVQSGVLVYPDAGDQNTLYSTSGLSNYPEPGQTFRADVWWDGEPGTQGYNYGLNGTDENHGVGYRTHITGRDSGGGEIRIDRWDSDGFTKDLVTADFNISSYAGEWLTLETEWV